jgi:hypothetical protein
VEGPGDGRADNEDDACRNDNGRRRARGHGGRTEKKICRRDWGRGGWTDGTEARVERNGLLASVAGSGVRA